MQQPPNSTVLNGPSGELTMAFKEAQKTNVPMQPNNIRPQSPRPPGQPGQSVPAPQQFQGQPRVFAPPPGPTGPQFRAAPFNNQQRFPQSGPIDPQTGHPIAGHIIQPPFRPQQRFIAVNPPGVVRPNIRPQDLPGAPHFARPQRPPGLHPQQSFSGSLPVNRGVELLRSNTVDSSATALLPNAVIKQEAKEEKDVKSNELTTPPLRLNEEPSKVETPLQGVTADILSLTRLKNDQPGGPPTASLPPNTLTLNSNSTESKNSSSSSPQQESVIEIKSKEAKDSPVKSSQDKPPMIPRPTSKPPSRNQKKEGDNDSGVDETTQGNDQLTNDDQTPRKAPQRNNDRLTTPTKRRSFSRGSRSPHLMSPDSQPGTPGPTEKKKIPMNKVQVGFAPSPNLKVVKSKIGSLANASHKPGGGHVKIETKKVDVSQATSRIGAKNDTYTPSGGEKKILSQKLQWNAKSKIGSLDNTAHKPKGGEKKIESVKLDFKERAKSKVGSKDNIQHVPGGGDVKIADRKINIQAESKIGSMDNVKHKPGGGEKKIFDDREYLRQRSAGGISNEENTSMGGSQTSLPSQHSPHSDNKEPVSDENLNREN